MKRWSLLIVLAILILVPIACGRGNKGLTPVTFMLDWVPNTNHTGIFVAQAKGYFKEAGLDVEIIQPGEVRPEAAVASGATEFGISFQEIVTLARSKKSPLFSAGAVLHQTPSVFPPPAGKNVKAPADFEGLRYGSFG